jgi:hypothetical protein
MSLEVEQRVRAARRRLVWAMAVVAALALAAVAAVLGLRGGPDSAGSASASTPAGISPSPSVVQESAPSTAGSAPSAGGSGWVPPARQVTLPAGTKRIEEYPVGFPRTPQGAAAAEVAKDVYIATTDYAQANRILRLYMAAHLAQTADAASTASVAQLRRDLGVPEQGPAPIDRYLVTRPLGVQWRQLDPDKVEVSVFGRSDLHTPGKVTTSLAGQTTVWQWLDDPDRGPDWRLVDGYPPRAKLAALGTQAFNDAGWSALVTVDGS